MLETTRYSYDCLSNHFEHTLNNPSRSGRQLHGFRERERGEVRDGLFESLLEPPAVDRARSFGGAVGGWGRLVRRLRRSRALRCLRGSQVIRNFMAPAKEIKGVVKVWPRGPGPLNIWNNGSKCT